MRRPAAALVACVLAFASAAGAAPDAQGSPILSGNASSDLAFSRRLAEEGFSDLAIVVLGKIERIGGTDAALVRATRTYLAYCDIQRIPGAIARKDGLVRLIADFERDFPELCRVLPEPEVRARLRQLHLDAGEALVEAVSLAATEVEAAPLRREAEALLAPDEKDALRQMESRPGEDEHPLARLRAAARLLYVHARLFPEGSARRVELCSKAYSALTDFDWEGWTDEVLADTYIESGVLLAEMGKLDDALQSIDFVLHLVGDFGGDPGGRSRTLPPEFLDVIARAAMEKMRILRRAKRSREVVAAGTDFLQSVANARESQWAVSIGRALIREQTELHDSEGVRRTLAMFDGSFARWYASQYEPAWRALYKSACHNLATKVPAGWDEAFAILRGIVADTAGTPDEAEAGCECFVQMGDAFQRRGWLEEAAFAYEVAAERYSKANGALDAIDGARRVYRMLQGGAQRPSYRRRIDSLNRFLVERARELGPSPPCKFISGALEFEMDGDYAEAIKLHALVPETSDGYWRARAAIAIDTYNWMVKRLADEDVDGAKELFPVAESALKAMPPILDGARSRTLDAKVLSDIDRMDFLVRFTLAFMYLNDAFGRVQDAEAVIDGLEAQWGKDPKKGPMIRDLRARTFLSQGKIEEAEAWVAELAERDSFAAADLFGALASSLDERSAAMLRADPASAVAAGWRSKAAKYYVLSVRPQLLRRVPRDEPRLKAVADRLFVFGLERNEPPEGRVSFLNGSGGPVEAPELWTSAAEMYEAVLDAAPDAVVRMQLGRTYAFLGRWDDAARAYAPIFGGDATGASDAGRRAEPAWAKEHPELVLAFVEWAGAERRAASASQDQAGIARTLKMLASVLQSIKPAGVNAFAWWAAKYEQIRAYYDFGDFKNTDLGIEDLERNVSATFDDGRYGYRKLFEALRDELR